jgi:hypothetical protein
MLLLPGSQYTNKGFLDVHEEIRQHLGVPIYTVIVDMPTQFSVQILECFSYRRVHIFFKPCFLQVYKSIGAVLVNSNLAESYNINNIYNVVYDGKWTYDKLKEWASLTGGDINGDSKMDENDSYGLYSPNI